MASIVEDRKVERSTSDYAKRLELFSLPAFIASCVCVFLFLLQSNIPRGKIISKHKHQNKNKKTTALGMFVQQWQNLEAPKGEATTSMIDTVAPVTRTPIAQNNPKP